VNYKLTDEIDGFMDILHFVMNCLMWPAIIYFSINKFLWTYVLNPYREIISDDSTEVEKQDGKEIIIV
jgi:hypothetical protein